jgi:hypothetical protein
MTGHPTDTGSILPERLASLGPNVIGATGGSGTRVVAGIARDAGMYIGERLNAYEDALDMADYLDRWINPYVGREDGDLPEALAGPMTDGLRAFVERHCARIPPEARRWGWKEPRSIYVLPFLRARMPSLRFLHFVRDGRDMALSENQNQLVKHGKAVLGGERISRRRPVRSIALWSRANCDAADYCERELGDAYLRVRFEDLCAEPAATVAGILGFFGLEGDAEQFASAVRPPSTLGRWQAKGDRLVGELERVGGEGLRRFGYL